MNMIAHYLAFKPIPAETARAVNTLVNRGKAIDSADDADGFFRDAIICETDSEECRENARLAYFIYLRERGVTTTVARQQVKAIVKSP